MRLASLPPALGLVLLAAPAAEAATLEPLRPCYVSVDRDTRQTVAVRAWGFSPHAVVDLTVDGRTRMVDADLQGGVRAGVAAPYVARGQRAFGVTLAEVGDPASAVSATTLVTALRVAVWPREAATSSRVRFRGRGFTSPRAIWGHYVLRGRVRRTVRMAAEPSGPCGTFSVRRRQIPVENPRAGRWTLQVDQQRRWSPRPRSVYVRMPIVVERVIG